MITSVPGLSALTIPVAEPIVAMDGVALLHVPPAEPSVNVTAAAPGHSGDVPDITTGKGLIVSGAVI